MYNIFVFYRAKHNSPIKIFEMDCFIGIQISSDLRYKWLNNSTNKAPFFS